MLEVRRGDREQRLSYRDQPLRSCLIGGQIVRVGGADRPKIVGSGPFVKRSRRCVRRVSDRSTQSYSNPPSTAAIGAIWLR